MKNLIILISLLVSFSVLGEEARQDPIRVGVLDTGFDFNSTWKNAPDGLVKPKLCKSGHKDFTNTSLQDDHGHGTHVAGIIAKHAGKSNYCLVIIKVYSPKRQNPIIYSIQGLKYALKIGVDIINYSAGGVDFSYAEYEVVQALLNKGIKLVAAAGNEGAYLKHHVFDAQKTYMYDSSGRTLVYRYKVRHIDVTNSKLTSNTVTGYYPAMYDKRVISVGNYIVKDSKWGRLSNKGPAVMFRSNGTDVMSLLPDNNFGKMSGTSQATPKVVATIINNWNN